MVGVDALKMQSVINMHVVWFAHVSKLLGNAREGINHTHGDLGVHLRPDASDGFASIPKEKTCTTLTAFQS